MSIKKEDLDLDNPLNNFKLFFISDCYYRLLWNAGKESWKNKEHIARLTVFYSKHHPAKVISIVLHDFQINDINSLLSKYEGRELEMYNNIFKKYGVDPLSKEDSK